MSSGFMIMMETFVNNVLSFKWLPLRLFAVGINLGLQVTVSIKVIKIGVEQI